MLDRRGRGADHQCRVACVRSPIVRLLLSQNPQVVDQRAAAFAGERQRRGHAFAGRAGDRERQVAFAAQAQRRPCTGRSSRTASCPCARPILVMLRTLFEWMMPCGGSRARSTWPWRSPRRRRGSGRTARTASSARPARTGCDSSVSPKSSSTSRRHALADAAGQHGRVLADEILGRHVVLVFAFADRGDRHFGQARRSRAAFSRTAPARSMAAIIASNTSSTTKTSFSAMQSRLLS